MKAYQPDPYTAGRACGAGLAAKVTDLEHYTHNLQVAELRVPDMVPLDEAGRRDWLRGYAAGILAQLDTTGTLDADRASVAATPDFMAALERDVAVLRGFVDALAGADEHSDLTAALAAYQSLAYAEERYRELRAEVAHRFGALSRDDKRAYIEAVRVLDEEIRP